MSKPLPTLAAVLLASLALTGCTVNVNEASAAKHSATATAEQTRQASPTQTATSDADTDTDTETDAGATTSDDSASSASKDAAFDAALTTAVDGIDATNYVDLTQMTSYQSAAKLLCVKLNDGVSIDSLIGTASQSNETEVLMLLLLASATADDSYCPGYQDAVRAYADANN
ncbi:hypothetical protein [Gryllotalpicola ginsengisoli]|uniref:hypothetical protein n=1 Tax=Gryllotalpicola ginsengisoli TaxID=444608 RepID=UPI0003B485E7|nr:hypothetical protein [Gryllotalpicola ginsengisoli]